MIIEKRGVFSTGFLDTIKSTFTYPIMDANKRLLYCNGMATAYLDILPQFSIGDNGSLTTSAIRVAQDIAKQPRIDEYDLYVLMQGYIACDVATEVFYHSIDSLTKHYFCRGIPTIKPRYWYPIYFLEEHLGYAPTYQSLLDNGMIDMDIIGQFGLRLWQLLKDCEIVAKCNNGKITPDLHSGNWGIDSDYRLVTFDPFTSGCRNVVTA